MTINDPIFKRKYNTKKKCILSENQRPNLQKNVHTQERIYEVRINDPINEESYWKQKRSMDQQNVSIKIERNGKWREKGVYKSVGGGRVFGEEGVAELEGRLELTGIDGVPNGAKTTLRHTTRHSQLARHLLRGPKTPLSLSRSLCPFACFSLLIRVLGSPRSQPKLRKK